MGGGLGGLVDYVCTKGGVLIFGYAVGVNGAYVTMVICLIFWLSWYIFICSEVVYVYLAYIWLSSWELESVRLYIYVLVFFLSQGMRIVCLLWMHHNTHWLLLLNFLNENISGPFCPINTFSRSMHPTRTV